MKKSSATEKLASQKCKIDSAKHILGSMPNVSNQIWSNVWIKKDILVRTNIIKSKISKYSSMMLMITKNPRENLFWLNKVSSNRNFLRIKNKIIHACCRAWAYHRDYRILQESIESKKAKNKNSNEIILLYILMV